jgi:HTH-type transcriptional regulator, sugar sensing transcriptional regulator
MEIKDVLEQFGLVGKKADVYLAALELGSASAIDISKKAGIKRTTCYNVLLDLINEGLISQTSIGKKHLFAGEAPEKIQRQLQNKERLFSEILPQLKSIHNARGKKPKIRYYEGKEGLREVYEDTLNHGGKEILGFISYDVVNALGKEWMDGYVKRRVKKGVYGKAIAPSTKAIMDDYIKKDQEQRRSTKLISSEEFPFSIEINIYGYQHVALISSREEIGIIIEGQEIHNTLKLIFNLVWKLLPEIKIIQ